MSNSVITRFDCHYSDVIIGAISSQFPSLTIVYSTVYSEADQRKHQSSVSLAFVRGIHRWPVNSPHKWPVTRKMFPFDDVIMFMQSNLVLSWSNNQCIRYFPLDSFCFKQKTKTEKKVLLTLTATTKDITECNQMFYILAKISALGMRRYLVRSQP